MGIKHFFADGYGMNEKGDQCLPLCDCIQSKDTCNSTEETCNCIIGEKCKFECPPERFGENCKEICRCKNNGTCHHISGECNCATGFTGSKFYIFYLQNIQKFWKLYTCLILGNLCQVCPKGMYGHECKEKCVCSNDASCSGETGNSLKSLIQILFYNQEMFDVKVNVSVPPDGQGKSAINLVI